MKALAVFPSSREVRLIDQPEPVIAGPTEVKLRILEAGICGTDREITKVDFENGNHWTYSAKFIISRVLERLPLGFSLSVKKAFDGGDKEFQINFVTTYYFRSQ